MNKYLILTPLGLGSLLSSLIIKTFVHTNSQLVMPDPDVYRQSFGTCQQPNRIPGFPSYRGHHARDSVTCLNYYRLTSVMTYLTTGMKIEHNCEKWYGFIFYTLSKGKTLGKINLFTNNHKEEFP